MSAFSLPAPIILGRAKTFMEYVISLLGPMWSGAQVTLKLFVITMALSIPLGLVLALVRISRLRSLSAAVGAYIWLMRGTPLMLQLLFIYFALPFVPVIGVRLPDFPSAVVAFALNYAAYFAEIFRAGIQSIDRGQFEAARSLGMSFRRTMFHVILPQAFRRMLPPLGNNAIALLKDSSLISAIGLAELAYAARTVAGAYSRYWEPYLVISLMYWLMTLGLAYGVRKLEARYGRGDTR